MRFYITILIVLNIFILFTGCSGKDDNIEDDSYFSRVVKVIPSYSSAATWESWTMVSTLQGSDKKDYSFIASCIIKRNGNEIVGFGNANGYSLGNFVVSGIRTGDNLDFKILSQNRYRAFELSGRGIYQNNNTKIGGNRINGKDFWTAFKDPIDYTGNFEIIVNPLTSPKKGVNFIGKLNGAYNSVENGEITLTTNSDGTILNIKSFRGGFVGKNQSEGVFNVDNPSVFGDIPIVSFSFSKVMVIGDYTVQFNGAISGNIASGFVIIQRLQNTYIGAFTAVTE